MGWDTQGMMGDFPSFVPFGFPFRTQTNMVTLGWFFGLVVWGFEPLVLVETKMGNHPKTTPESTTKPPRKTGKVDKREGGYQNSRLPSGFPFKPHERQEGYLPKKRPLGSPPPSGLAGHWRWFPSFLRQVFSAVGGEGFAVASAVLSQSRKPQVVAVVKEIHRSIDLKTARKAHRKCSQASAKSESELFKVFPLNGPPCLVMPPKGEAFFVLGLWGHNVLFWE